MITLLTNKNNINGLPIEDAIKEIVGYKNAKDFFVIEDGNGTVSQIEDSNVIREQLKVDSTLTVLEVGEAYIKSLETPADVIVDEDKVSTAEALIDFDMRLSALENK